MRPGSTPWRRLPPRSGSAAPRSIGTLLALTRALVRNVPSAWGWLKLEERANELFLGRTASSTRLAAAHQAERGSWRGTQECKWGLEPVFDILGRWGHGTTLAWAGRSRRRWTGAPSCSASTWPASARPRP